MKRSSVTRERIRVGAAALERLVRQAPFSDKTGCHLYEGRISVKEVLRLAGVRSAATLHHLHHSATKKWLDEKIKELKALAGRGRSRKDQEEHLGSLQRREKRLAEELAAAHYKIMALERELVLAKDGKRKQSKVVQFRKKRPV